MISTRFNDTNHHPPMHTEEGHKWVVHNPPRVLIAEDDVEMRRIIGEIFREDGYDVREVPDGGRLLVQVTAQYFHPEAKVDLIVSDIRMPICSGIEILQSLRNARWFMPVILMTAFGDYETRRRVEDLGGILFDKPFRMDDLREAARELLSRAAR